MKKGYKFHIMLPFVNEEDYQLAATEIFKDVSKWRKAMIHYIKEQNPEINTAIVELAQITELDPKALATGAYAVYKMLEIASSNSTNLSLDD